MADLNLERLLRALAEAEIDFVVVGGVAVNALGYQRYTKDLDIVYATDQANLDALGAVLVELNARLKGVGEDVPFVPDGRTLRGTRILTLDSDAGQIDLLVEPPGAPAYAELKARAFTATPHGIEVLVASLEDMLSMKRAAGRGPDTIDVQALEVIARMTRKHPRGPRGGRSG
ncbi:MAG TPA: nucleotidyl transferase AbiEii/AbiGii toxin family protein [Solirubrobacteraceae bacterium]|jgi:predicted nucleotidyltransferase|nr:nucleotidyl transferase AbiEii/AbiGii toxin family protein [Solirubrobacteraceae bacterium]